MSSFAWLAYSETERDRALQLVDAFRDRDTRDELGIGRIRDAFADMLFPGTSTIQTRARYFFFIPWMYSKFERREVPSDEIARKVRRFETTDLIPALLDSDDTEGLIGKDARQDLKRLPSSIYWNGLSTWGILRFDGSQNQYHRQLDQYYRFRAGEERTDTGDPVQSVGPNWRRDLPDPPDEFPDQASMWLTEEEAAYLQGRILDSVPDTFLASMVYIEDLGAAADFPWEYEHLDQTPSHVREQMAHARNFSEVIHGAALLYNLMLAEEAEDPELTQKYRDELDDWRRLIDRRRSALDDWDLSRFWQIVDQQASRIPPPTVRFVETWTELVLSAGGPEIEEEAQARALIKDREWHLKRSRARLHNQRALELWSGDAGTGRLDYRWGIAKAHVTDILEALEGA